MTTIIDASTLSAFLLEEDGHEKIRGLLLKGTFATELALTESINAVLSALRRGRIEDEAGDKAIQVLLSFVGSNIRIVQQEESLVWETFRVAKEHGLASYDAVYIALAKHLGGSLASRDPKQIDAANKFGVKTITT